MDASKPISVRLSPQERTLLCAEIYRFSLLLGRETPSQNAESVAVATDSRAEGSPWERLALLVDLWPRLQSALQGIAASPDSAAEETSHSVPIHAVRGGPATLARLARNPADHRAWIRTTYHAEAETPARVQERRSTPTLQTLPNRIAADFLESLGRETRALHRLALFCEEATAIIASAELSRQIHHWRRQSPFCDCSGSLQSGLPLPAETLLRCSPAYRSLYTVIGQSRAGFRIDWSDSAILRFPVLETWHLYEIWCFLRVGVALRSLGWQPFENDCLQIVPAGMRLRLAHGKPSRIRFRAAVRMEGASQADPILELLYQPQFASANRTSGLPQTAFRSLSHVMQPDIALVRKGRLLLLDPKYRSYGEIGEEQEDVDKMHTYRDAIVRTDSDTGRTIPAVDAAWCLFPGLPASPASRPNPLRAYPTSTPTLPFGTAGIGAVQVRPGIKNTELSDLLRYWLDVDG
ncbi:MAG: hypothetical protein JWL77_1718 [Chthonomonadaceae bacterium]|nr:hypothetical protein [Chthonomonadaceae bacterium]